MAKGSKQAFKELNCAIRLVLSLIWPYSLWHCCCLRVSTMYGWLSSLSWAEFGFCSPNILNKCVLQLFYIHSNAIFKRSSDSHAIYGAMLWILFFLSVFLPFSWISYSILSMKLIHVSCFGSTPNTLVQWHIHFVERGKKSAQRTAFKVYNAAAAEAFEKLGSGTNISASSFLPSGRFARFFRCCENKHSLHTRS